MSAPEPVKKRRAIALAIAHAAQPAHAVVHDHAAGDLAGPLQVVLRAGRDVVEDDLLGDRARQQHLDPAFQLALRHQIAIVVGALHRVAERRQAARDDRHLVHRIGVRQAVGHQGMPAFVIGDALLLVDVDDALPLLQAGHDPLDPFVELVHADRCSCLCGRPTAPPR